MTQVLLINNGSLTQNLNSITGKPIHIHFIQQEFNHSKQIKRKIWIINTFHRLVYAESIWNAAYNKILQFTNNQAIGQNIITNEIDIYKQITYIAYIYNYAIEKKLKQNCLFWKREYIIWCDYLPLIKIEEFFSNILNKLNI